MERITTPEDKYALYMELRSYWKAMEVATKLKDPYKLQDVSTLCLCVLLIFSFEI